MLSIADDSWRRIWAVTANQWHTMASNREVNPWWVPSTVERGSAVNWWPLPRELNVFTVHVAFTRALVCLFHVPYFGQAWLHGQIKLVCALWQWKQVFWTFITSSVIKKFAFILCNKLKFLFLQNEIKRNILSLYIINKLAIPIITPLTFHVCIKL